MPNELQALLAANKDTIREGAPIRKRKIRHLIFTGNPSDVISIPLCGVIKDRIMALTRLDEGVTCIACLETAKHLAGLDTYKDALNYIASIAPVMLQPNMAIMLERHGQQPTKEANLHIEADTFLRSKLIDKAIDLPKNIIGTKKSTYYFNMVELDLKYGPSDSIDGTLIGEANPMKLQSIQEQIDDIQVEQG